MYKNIRARESIVTKYANRLKVNQFTPSYPRVSFFGFVFLFVFLFVFFLLPSAAVSQAPAMVTTNLSTQAENLLTDESHQKLVSRLEEVLNNELKAAASFKPSKVGWAELWAVFVLNSYFKAI